MTRVPQSFWYRYHTKMVPQSFWYRYFGTGTKLVPQSFWYRYQIGTAIILVPQSFWYRYHTNWPEPTMLLKSSIMLFLYAPKTRPLCSHYAPIMLHTKLHTIRNSTVFTGPTAARGAARLSGRCELSRGNRHKASNSSGDDDARVGLTRSRRKCRCFPWCGSAG